MSRIFFLCFQLSFRADSKLQLKIIINTRRRKGRQFDEEFRKGYFMKMISRADNRVNFNIFLINLLDFGKISTYIKDEGEIEEC